ncbi:aminoacyl-tRNA hydrolase [Bacteroidota bacterium]
MKYLIAGLGNIGEEYSGTRHNIGFMILDALASASNIFFEPARLADKCTTKHRGRTFILIKPSTYVNLSGRAVHYWLKKEKIPLERFLVVLDDIALPYGTLRMRPHGGSGGHNGLEHITQILGTQNYARLRFGIGDEFHHGQQVNHVLGEWTTEENATLEDRMKTASEIIFSFGVVGLERTMNKYNNK